MRSPLLLGLTVLLSACTGTGTFGVERSDDGLLLLSECSDAGISAVRVGPDIGERESNSVFPRLTDATFTIDWPGDPRDARGAIDLASPGSDYIITEVHPDPESDITILIEAHFQLGALATTQIVTASELRDGFVRVPIEKEAGSFEFVDAADFEDRLRECSPGSMAAWNVIPVGLVVVLICVVVFVSREWRDDRHRRSLPPPAPS